MTTHEVRKPQALTWIFHAQVAADGIRRCLGCGKSAPTAVGGYALSANGAEREIHGLRPVWLLAALGLAGLWLAGCHTTVYQQGDQAAASSRATASEVQTQSQAIEATLTTLSNLVYQPTADLKPQFLAFSSALDRLAAAAGQGGVMGSHLARGNSNYFAAWNTQLTTITNADVRSRNDARRIAVSNQFNAANQQYSQAQGALWSLVYYLQDIRRALSTDLTANGLEAEKPLVSTASANASNVQASLAQARSELTALGTAMSSAGALSEK